MKLLTKLSLIAATVAALSQSAALADNSTLRQQIDLDRQRMERNKKTTTVAVYTVKGIGHAESTNQRRGSHYELRRNANGQRFGLFVPNK